MITHPLLNRISADPQVCFGKPCVKGTRIWVSLVLDYLAAGSGFEAILEAYPQLCMDDVLACVAYGAAMSNEHFVRIDMAAA